MEFVIKIGKKYIGVIDSVYTDVDTVDMAFKSPTRYKLQNIIDNCVAPARRHKCKIIEVSKTLADVFNGNKEPDAPLAFNADSFEPMKKDLTDKLAKIDQEICDIYHYIEFNNLDAYRGFKAYKLLQDTLIRRREVKDDLLKIQIITETVVPDLFNGRLEQRIDGINKRTYKPRVLTELFE